MNLSDLQAQLEKTDDKVRLLLKQYVAQRARIAELEAENQSLHQENERQKEKMASFQQSTKIAKIADHLGVEGESAEEISEKIDEYIKEIDHCIAYINRQM